MIMLPSTFSDKTILKKGYLSRYYVCTYNGPSIMVLYFFADRKLNIACPMDAYLWNPQLHTKGLWEIQGKFKNMSYPVEIQKINP